MEIALQRVLKLLQQIAFKWIWHCFELLSNCEGARTCASFLSLSLSLACLCLVLSLSLIRRPNWGHARFMCTRMWVLVLECACERLCGRARWHVHACARVQVCLRVYVCARLWMCSCAHKCVCAYVCMCSCARVCVCVCVCVHLCVRVFAFALLSNCFQIAFKLPSSCLQIAFVLRLNCLSIALQLLLDWLQTILKRFQFAPVVLKLLSHSIPNGFTWFSNWLQIAFRLLSNRFQTS